MPICDVGIRARRPAACPISCSMPATWRAACFSGISPGGTSSRAARCSPLSGTPLPPPGRRVQPLDVRTALATAPMAQALRALILTDPRLRSYQFTSAARTADDNDLFFGTNGLGLVRIDGTVAQWEPLDLHAARDAGPMRWPSALTASGRPAAWRPGSADAAA